MSVKPDPSEDEEGNHGPEVPVVETNRFGFILGNGETDSDGPCPELVRHRESKWLNLISQWEQVMEKKSNKVKGQCQKGIPASVRAKCWPLLCGAKDRKEKNTELYKRLTEAPDHQGWTDIIKRDTDRQFPFHEMFQSKDGHGQKDLLEVLKAYTQYRPDEGYCQAQGPVAAVLLMNMPAEEAFWCLVQISELYLPGYYSPLLEGVLFDAAVLSSLLKKQCPAAHKHLHNQGVEPLMFATDWLMCLYSRHLPFNTLLRVWDLFFCYGVRVLFQVAVVLVRRCLGEGRQRKECDGQMETLERLRGVKKHVQNDQADAFIHEVCSVSLSLSDLQKQTEKEMEKWKKERPNSTFDPRGRCHGHRMVWEREQEKQKEHEKKERPKGSLTIPLMRSHSSLSPVLRKKWRKRSSKTDTEEWDGGGRTITRSLMEESDEEEVRRRSVCGIVGEQRAKRDRLTDELCTRKHKDHNTHPKISVVVSSSIDSDVFEKAHTETQGDEKERTAGCVVEESLQTHQHEQDTNQDELSTEAHQDEQNITKDQGDMSTEAPTNPKELNTDQQTRQDEQTVEIMVTLEVCEERTAETSQEEDTETDSSKQEKEIQSDCNIQEEDKQREPCTQQQEETKDRLPQVIMTQQIEENISHVNVVQEELRPETSTDQHEVQKEVDLYIVTSTEEDKETLIDENNEEGFEQELNVLPEEELPAPSEMCEEKDDKKLQEDMSLEQRDNDPHRADKEEIQTSEEVQTSSSLQIKTESDTEHQDGSADLLPQSQSSHPHDHDMDAAVTAGELEHCPVDSTVEDTVGSGNPEQNYVDSTEGINTLESQEEEPTETSRHSDVNNAISDQINPENSEENKPTVCENAICCEVETTDIKESCNLTQSVVIVDTCSSMNLESEEMHFTRESGHPESNVVDSTVGNPESYDAHATTVSDEHEINVTDGSEKTENNELQISVGSDNLESDICNAVENPETNQLLVTGSGNLESSDACLNTVSGSPERCNSDTITEHCDESGDAESNAVDSAVCNEENSNVVFTIGPGNSECSDLPVTSESVNSDDNTLDIVDASANQDFKEVHVTAESEKTQSNEMEIAVGSGSSESDLIEPTVENQESNEVLLTTKSGNPECSDEQVTTESESNVVDSAVGSGNPDCSEIHATPKSDHPETNSGHATYESGNSERNTEDPAAGSGNPHNTECAIENNQETQCSFSIPPSKSPNPNVPPAHLRVRRTSSSRVSYPTILSEDTFREPLQQEHTHTGKTTHTLTEDTNSQPNSPTKSGAPKRLGLFRRLRGDTHKTPVPKILIQDFSEKEERLTAKERRRRKREKERKEREEKERKKREEKDKEKSERKKPQTRGKSFQVLNRKCADNAASPGNSDSQTSRARRNSAPFSDSYF